MTPTSKVPTGLLDKGPSSNEELLILQKELDALHSNRRPFIWVCQEKVYMDEGEDYYSRLSEQQLSLIDSIDIKVNEGMPVSRWPWKESVDVTEDLAHD